MVLWLFSILFIEAADAFHFESSQLNAVEQVTYDVRTHINYFTYSFYISWSSTNIIFYMYIYHTQSSVSFHTSVFIYLHWNSFWCFIKFRMRILNRSFISNYFSTTLFPTLPIDLSLTHSHTAYDYLKCARDLKDLSVNKKKTSIVLALAYTQT